MDQKRQRRASARMPGNSFSPPARLLSAGAPVARARLAAVMLHVRGGSPADMAGLADHLALPDMAILAPGAAGGSWWPDSFLAPLDAKEPGRGSGLAVVAALPDALADRGFGPRAVRAHRVLAGRLSCAGSSGATGAPISGRRGAVGRAPRHGGGGWPGAERSLRAHGQAVRLRRTARRGDGPDRLPRARSPRLHIPTSRASGCAKARRG